MTDRPGTDLHVVVPAEVDDPELPSGGNAYDRRVCRELAAAGRRVRELAVAGAWPRPSAADRAVLVRALARVPDGGPVLLDGLVACGVPEVVTAHAGRLRLVALVHLPLGDEQGNTPEVSSTLAAAEAATLRAVAAVVATSPWAARRLIATHGLDPARVHVAAPGVDPAAPAVATPGGGRLACIGSVSRTKGQDVLVEALARVADRDWECVLVGPQRRDPAQVAAVRAAVERYRLTGRVRLTGTLPPDRVAEVYAATDLLVLPSRAETYGMVLTEALARAVPVLATAVGGVPETLGASPDSVTPDSPSRITGPPGMVVPADDAPALAAALRDWLDDPALRDLLRRRARNRRGELTGWEVTARCVARVLDRLPASTG